MKYSNMRKAYGQALLELGAKDERVVALEADLGKSTMSYMFGQAYPERYFEMGIAEANMTSVAAGLAQTGRVAFTHSFAVFSAGRAYDQLRQSVGIGELNVKVCGSSAGVSDFGDGSTHQSVEDMAIMCAIPTMTVLCPADAPQAAAMVDYMAKRHGPCYIRICRNDVPEVTGAKATFDPAPQLLRQGSDVVVFTCGIMAAKALEAAEMLSGELSVRVVNVAQIKPLDDNAVREFAKGMRGVVVAQEHSVMGGLGTAVLSALSLSRLPVVQVGINDCYGVSAHNYDDVLSAMGLTAQAIADAAKKAAQ